MAFDYHSLKAEVEQLKQSKALNANVDYRNNLEADRLIEIAEESLEEVFRLQEHPKVVPPEPVVEKKEEKKETKKPKK